MKILGNRALLSKVEDEKKQGEFSTVDVQDNFIYKGKVEQIASEEPTEIKVGDVVYFAKYSPHTHDIENMKSVRLEDIIAIK